MRNGALDQCCDQLLASSDRIRIEVGNVAKDVGAKMPKLASDEDIKSSYFDFFGALVDTMVSSEQQEVFLKQFSTLFASAPESIDRSAVFERLRSHFETSIPDNFELITKLKFRANNLKTDPLRTRQRVAEFVLAQRSKL